jgi:hypothetical protein
LKLPYWLSQCDKLALDATGKEPCSECREFAGADDDACVLLGPEIVFAEQTHRGFPDLMPTGPSEEEMNDIDFSDEEEEEKQGWYSMTQL